MVRAGFPSDSALGQLCRIVEARLKSKGQSIAIVNQGYQRLDGVMEDDREVLQPDELLEFTYADFAYYPDLYRLGFPLPFVPDDFDPKTSEDEAFRIKFREILAGVKREAAKKFDPRAKTREFQQEFLDQLVQRSKIFISKVDYNCFPKTLLEMKEPACIPYSSKFLFLYAAIQAAGLENLFVMESRSAALNIENWGELFPELDLWMEGAAVSYWQDSSNEEGGGIPGTRISLTPFKLTKEWLLERWQQALRDKRWEEAEKAAKTMMQMNPQRIGSWRALASVYGQSGELEKYQKLVLEFETRFQQDEDYPFQRAMIKFDQLQWEWEQGNIQEGELTAVLRELEKALEKSKRESLADYADSTYTIAHRLWSFAKNLGASGDEKRSAELKAVLESYGFEFLLQSIEARPVRIGPFVTALKIGLERGGDYMERLYAASQRIFLKNPEHPFFLYFACLVQEERFNRRETLSPDEKAIWNAQVKKLEKLKTGGRMVLELLANSWTSLDDLPRSIHYFEKLIRAQPKNSPGLKSLYFLAAQRYATLGQKEGALRDLAHLKSLIKKEDINMLAGILVQLPWALMIDKKTEWIRSNVGGIEILAHWLKENGADGNLVDPLFAFIVIGYWGSGVPEKAKPILADKAQQTSFTNLLFKQSLSLVEKIRLERSSQERLVFLTHFADSLKASGFLQNPLGVRLYLYTQLGRIVEALYLNDEAVMREATAGFLSFHNGELYLAAINNVYQFLLENRGDSSRRNMACLFFAELTKYKQRLPVYFRNILKIRYQDVADILTREGDLERARMLSTVGGIDGAN